MFLYQREYEKFQWLPPEQIAVYRQQQLSKTVRFARQNSPFYRQHYAAIEDVSGRDCSEYFTDLPALSKQQLIGNAEQIVTSKKKWASPKTTGGSTGEPVKLYKNPQALARERAATWRAYGWAGVKVGDKQARFWGVPHSGQDKMKAKLTDIAANRMRVSAFNLTESSLADYDRQIRRYRPDYLYGYVSVIEAYARFIEENRKPPVASLKAVITTSEVLTEKSRTSIADAFRVKVFNEYGCGEVGSIAHECEYGNMHIMADNVHVEIDGEGSGEIIVTDFHNLAMPLIRYKLGDYGELVDDTCECGRSLPILKGIHGRAYDVIHTSSGRRLHPEAIMYIFEGIQSKYKAFKQFQVIQEKIDSFTANVVPTDKWSDSVAQMIQAVVKEKICDDITVECHIVDTIAREASGKMRVVKSRLNHD